MINKYFSILLLTSLLTSCVANSTDTETSNSDTIITESPEQTLLARPPKNIREYESTDIYGTIWMTENLDVKSFRNGDAIIQVKSPEEWVKACEDKVPVWCYYNDDENSNSFGKIYNIYAVLDARGLAPKGWKIADESDYNYLRSNISSSNPADQIKDGSSWGLKDQSNNTARTKLNMLKCGKRRSDGTFVNITTGATVKGLPWSEWWALSSNGTPYSFSLSKHNFIMPPAEVKSNSCEGRYVRCVKD